MRRIVFVIAIILAALPMFPAHAQGEQECDPTQLQEWIEQRQVWRQATQDTLDTPGVSVDSALLQLAEHLQNIENLERPACADKAMLWTYFLYTNLQHLLICDLSGDTECTAEMQTRLADYRERDEDVMTELTTANGLSTDILQPPAPAQASLSQTLGPISDPSGRESFTLEVSIVDVQFTKGAGFFEAQAGFVYALVSVTVKNLGPGALYGLWGNSFQLHDASGAVWENELMVSPDCYMDLADVMPGDSLSGCVSFEVPEAGNLDLVFAPYIFEGLEPGRYLSFRIR